MAAAWTPDELQRIAAADELELASARGDGAMRKPVTIWVVRLGDGLYVERMTRPPARETTLQLVPATP